MSKFIWKMLIGFRLQDRSKDAPSREEAIQSSQFLDRDFGWSPLRVEVVEG
jgi:hypothetical protein